MGDIKITKKMMDTEIYWQIISEAVENSNNQEEQENYLVKKLQNFSLQDVIGFRLRTDKLLYDSYTSNLWCAGYIMNGGCSDDGFEYFRCWLISRGKAIFENALANPDSLLTEVNPEIDYYEFEDFWYVALKAFQEMCGEDLYDYIDEAFEYKEGSYPQFKFSWQEDDNESLKRICPKLFEAFEKQ